MHLPLRQRKADAGQGGMPLDEPFDTVKLEQFCSSELSQQSLAPSQIQDGWIQAVVFSQF